MAITNPERGEIDLVVNDEHFTLKLSMNAAVALERKLKKSIGEVLQQTGALNFEAMRSIMWMLLQKHHADRFKTEEQVGAWIDDAGGVAVFLTTLARIAGANRDEEGSGGAGNPPGTQTH